MFDLRWSPSEKKIARRAFDIAFARACDRLIAEIKEKAAALERPEQLWELEQRLRSARREIDEQFDFRYSQLPLVLAVQLRHQTLSEEELTGLSEDKLDIIRRLSQ